jgi:hypothetical protein
MTNGHADGAEKDSPKGQITGKESSEKRSGFFVRKVAPDAQKRVKGTKAHKTGQHQYTGHYQGHDAYRTREDTKIVKENKRNG